MSKKGLHLPGPSGGHSGGPIKLGWLGKLLRGTGRPCVRSQRQNLGLEEVRGGHGGSGELLTSTERWKEYFEALRELGSSVGQIHPEFLQYPDVDF